MTSNSPTLLSLMSNVARRQVIGVGSGVVLGKKLKMRLEIRAEDRERADRGEGADIEKGAEDETGNTAGNGARAWTEDGSGEGAIDEGLGLGWGGFGNRAWVLLKMSCG